MCSMDSSVPMRVASRGTTGGARKVIGFVIAEIRCDALTRVGQSMTHRVHIRQDHSSISFICFYGCGML